MASTETKHPLVEDYLQRLDAAAQKLPRGQRRELLADTETYLDQAIKRDASAIEARGLLATLGTPEALAAQDRPKKVKADPNANELPAITLVALGGFFIGVGWFVGVYLLWRSRSFTLTDKLIGTLLWPGGLASALVVALAFVASSLDAGPLLAVGVLVVPLLTAAYLYRRAPRG